MKPILMEPQTLKDTAYNLGWLAGREGVITRERNPYDESVPVLRDEWYKGWDNGKACSKGQPSTRRS